MAQYDAVTPILCKYAYFHNTACLFSKINVKELQSNSIIQEIDNPGLLAAAQLAGQPHDTFWGEDSLHKCDDYLAGVKNFVPAWPICLDPADVTEGKRETPVGGIAPRKGDTTRGRGECTIPHFQLENEYDAHAQVDVECKTGAAAGINTFIQPGHEKCPVPNRFQIRTRISIV